MKLVLDDGSEVELDKCQVVEAGPDDKFWVVIRKQLDSDELESVVEALGHAFGPDRCLLTHGVDGDIKVVRDADS